MDVWKKCVELLKGDLNTAEFNTWILPLQSSESNGQLHLFAPNRFVRDWVNQHYHQQLLELCTHLSQGAITGLSFEVGTLARAEALTAGATSRRPLPGSPEEEACALAVAETRAQRRREGCLNPDFSFDSFVEGKSNQIARAASIQIGNNPGVAYNPLFVYGGVGLGKTHLMHAVGNAILEANPEARVVYLHSERFVSEMVKALQHNSIDEFKRHYRSVNALLIDDVQFFAGKERSQEEFFHTFNVLFESRQQIILTSDRFPKELPGLEERLRSRFGWGLTVSIEPPDLETRVAILQSKASYLHIDLPEEVAFFVAGRIRSNIRELEGALRRLGANSEFTGRPITLDFATNALRDMLAAQDKQVTIENIQKVVAEHYKLKTSDMLSAKRNRSVARPRQVAMALAKELTRHSLPEIGNAFGKRDHTTVLHATRKVKELCVSDPGIEEDYRILLRTLTS